MKVKNSVIAVLLLATAIAAVLAGRAQADMGMGSLGPELGGSSDDMTLDDPGKLPREPDMFVNDPGKLPSQPQMFFDDSGRVPNESNMFLSDPGHIPNQPNMDIEPQQDLDGDDDIVR